MKKNLSVLIILLTGISWNCHFEKEMPLFQLVDGRESGIHFSNDLSNSDSLIALSFEYLFNGSGVAIADFNNDGLSDVFFTANMKESRLYLNKGDLKFEDITQRSKINTKGKWASGAVVGDINQDGWMDIYVCVGGLSTDQEKRANLLFINQQDNTFKEEAAAYGLADAGYSINAAFLDYDKDGDLDLYVLTTELDPYNWTEFRPRRLNGEAPNTDKLYRNNGDNTFTNVSSEAGITIEGYGLGLGLCDLNEDGLTDLYIANDFLSNDIIYINNGDGTFSDKIDDYLSHTSRNGMGTDLQDFNNDGHTDIVVVDMLPTTNARQKSMFGFFNYDKFKLGIESGYQPQYARNTLQVNNGNGTFSEVGQLAGIDKTDWSWCSLFADFDNDGWQDLFITNGYRQDITNMDFATYSRQLTSSPIGTEEAKNKKMMAKLKDLPEIKLPNFMFKNEGTFPFENKSKDWGFDLPSFSNGAAYADLDNDGDLDLVINNIDSKAFVYKNTLYTNETRNTNNYLRIKLTGNDDNKAAIGAKVVVHNGTNSQNRMVSPYRGYLSSVENILHFGLGTTSKVDKVEVFWTDGTYSSYTDLPSDTLLIFQQKATAQKLAAKAAPNKTSFVESVAANIDLDISHEETDFVDFKIQPILPHKHSQSGPGVAIGDVNGDGLEDVFLGGSAGIQGKLLIQTTAKKFEEKATTIEADFHDMGSLLFDADGDNDLDLYVVSGGSNFQNKLEKYQDRLYLNDGLGNFSKTNGLPIINASGASVAANDFDKDGDLDLLISGRVIPGAYPMAAKTYLLENESTVGQIKFTDRFDLLPNKGELGLVCQALWTDYDNDGWSDIMIAGEWMPITFLKNNGKDFSKEVLIPNSSGWWNSITSGDFDKDGDIDYIVGNLGLNTRYIASKQEPIEMYAKDFDKNGRIDPILCQYVEGQNYIAASRDMLIKQINSMRIRFKTYAQYGTTPLDQSFTKAELRDALSLTSENFSSSYIENLGGNNFTMKSLPTEAQVAPIYGMHADDVNGDGHLDILMVGNDYSSEIMVGQYDACKGTLLLGDGTGDFKNSPHAESGFFVDKNAKALVKLFGPDQQALYLATRNREKLKVFAKKYINQPKPLIALKDTETYGIIEAGNETNYKVEFYHGSSYLSQSSRQFEVPLDAKRITIFDVSGNNRVLTF